MAFQELRNACRSLLRVPALTGLSLATIALGVGAGTALFSVVKAVLLNPLPYPQPERLIWISEVNSSDRPMNVSMANYLDWARQNRTFSAMGGFASMPVNLAGDTPERIVASLVTPGFLEAMGAQPVLGRGFTSSDNVEGAPLSALIGYSLWQRVYNGDPGVLGRTIHLSGYSATIAGVLPRGFSYPERAELWISAVALGDYGTRTAHNYRVVGRLKPGVTLEQAQTDLSEIARRLKREYPGPYMAKDARLTPLLIHTAGKVRPALLILFGAVGLLLLIVCVNVANLLLVRVTSRSRELAVRLAIGAGRFHLVRQMLTESLVLACAGGILGFLLAFWSMDLLRVLLPPDIPRSGEIRVDGLVLAFSFAVSTAAGLLFGLLPAWRATRMNVHDAVKANSRTMTANRRMQQS